MSPDQQKTGTESPVGEEKIRLLLVEDDVESGQTLRAMLERRGVETILLSDACGALARLREGKFDVAVADIRLKGMSGMDLLGEIRREDPDFPVVLLTGYDSLSTAIAAVRLGAQDYIVKPLDGVEDLLTPVQKAVRAHRLSLRNKLLSEKLRESETQLRTILENSSDVIYRWNLRANRLDYVNHATESVLGYAPADLLARDTDELFALLHPDEHDTVRNALSAWRNDAGWTDYTRMDFRFMRTDGSWRWFNARHAPVRNGDGAITAVAGVARDVTDARAAEERERELRARLIRMERAEWMSVVAAGIVHDLNSIFFALIGMPDLMLENVKNGKALDLSEVKKNLASMRDTARQGAAIAHDLLMLGRQGRDYKLSVVNMNEIIEEQLQSAECQTLARSHPETTVRAQFDPHLRLIRGSRTHLKEVIINVIRNAYEAMTGAGELVLQTSNVRITEPFMGYELIEPGEYAVATVRDTGSGIKPEDLGHIFDPFFSRKKTNKDSGSGLGLAVVLGIVRDHGGRVHVQSQAGKGAEFFLYFPVLTETGADKKIPADKQPDSGSPSNTSGTLSCGY